MPGQRKIRSVLELAHYHCGDTAWWVILRASDDIPALTAADRWMENHHPKALYQRGPNRIAWPSKILLPKLQHMDFAAIVSILTSQLLTEPFIICDVVRSRDTGEFFYANDNDEWMPESMLCDTKIAAAREKIRILRLFKKWIERNQ